MDEINLRILDILSHDASRPFVEIAKELQISDATVHMRVRRLVAAGIIRKFTIAVDNRLLGYGHTAFMGVNIDHGSSTDDVTFHLSQIDEVLEVHEMHGRFDIVLKIRAQSLEEMRNIVVNKIRKLPYIKDCELMAVLKTIKEEQSVSLKKEISDKMGAAAT